MNLREQLLQSAPRKRIPVSYLGVEVELLAPTIKLRKTIIEKAGGQSGTILDLQSWVAILCTVEPGTTTRVFEDTDLDVLENTCTGSFLDLVGENMHSLLNVTGEEEQKKPEA